MDLDSQSDRCLDDDSRLMLCAAKGDCSAFTRLYLKYLPLVSNYLKSLGCHAAALPDLTQETFTRVWARKREYRGASTFKTYLFSYARRVLLEEWRSRLRTDRLTEHLSRNFLPAIIPASGNPETEAQRTELERQVECALTRLSPEQRHVVRLYYLERIPIGNAARSLGCTEKCLHERIRRARKKLYEIMSTRENTFPDP